MLLRALTQTIPPDNARRYDLEADDIVVGAPTCKEAKAKIAGQV